MPFKSEAQRRYLWANEPEIARDWTNTYGSRIQKNTGGIMRIPFRTAGAVAAAHGKAAASPGAVDRGGNNREKGIMSRGLGPQGTTGTIGNFQNQGPDRSAVGQFSTYGRNVMNQRLQGPSVFSKIGTGIKDYITGGGLIGMGIRGLTGLVNKFTGPKATEYGNLNMPGYNMLNIAGPVTRAAPTGDGEGGDGSNNQQLYAATNQYPIMGTTSEEGIETLVNNPGFIQRFRVKNPYRQDKQGQLDPAILEMINKLYT